MALYRGFLWEGLPLVGDYIKKISLLNNHNNQIYEIPAFAGMAYLLHFVIGIDDFYDCLWKR